MNLCRSVNCYNLCDCYHQTGKGDLVGCDMNTHLQAYNGTGQPQNNNPDVVVKSSSDVKVHTLDLLSNADI